VRRRVFPWEPTDTTRSKAVFRCCYDTYKEVRWSFVSGYVQLTPYFFLP
jgi:hypothetical protein